ncbi:MAG: VOC family protein [Planctomycetes bacterium]|nr:VOC family protein [Planctomycetota bacterium]
MPDPFPIEAVNHIARVTHDLEASLVFYQNVLGFRPIRRPNFQFPGAWLFNYGVQIHLIATSERNAPTSDISMRDDHVAFHVTDTDVVEKLLAEHGIDYRKNYVADTQVTQLFFLDPDGNHIEIGTYPPAQELA